MLGVHVFVWIDAWQQQCCGEDFGVGSDVTWSAVPQETRNEWTETLLGEAWADRIGYYQETHDDDATMVVIAGTVHSIREVTCRRTPQSQGAAQVMVPIAGSGMLKEVAVADKWSPEPSDDLRGRVSFDGWIIELVLSQ